MKKKYFTTPIYYINGTPHIGNAYTTIIADTLKRYYKLFGYDSMMLTGVDEHGQKVLETAVKNGKTPKEHCDSMLPNFVNLFNKCNIDYDVFFRTTDEDHKKNVQTILQRLYDKGDIYKGEYEGYYCTPCETFFTEKDLIDEKFCPECKREVTVVKEENYFFDMPKYADKLQEHIESHADFIFPKQRRGEVLGILKKGLKPLCITRRKEKMGWGIEIPFDKDFVTYVWFDALTNYINGIGYLKDDEKFNAFWPTTVHLLAKDILLHHTIYWPTMLLAMGLPLPKTFFIHGWWTSEGQKMSKSLGNVVDPNYFIDKYGVDSLRFYLLRDMSFGSDGNFTKKAFIDKHNTELSNDFGNLINRAVHMIVKNFDGSVPPCEKKTEYCDEFTEKFKAKTVQFAGLVEELEINKLLDDLFELIRTTNKYLENTAPWKLIKTDKELCGAVLYNALEAVRIAALLLKPVIPSKIAELESIFDGGMIYDLEFGKLPVGQKIAKIKALFPRIEEEKEEIKPKKEEKKENLITIDDFAKVEIKTGYVTACEKLAKSNKLLQLKIDLGEGEARNILSGIAKFYEPEQLIGKKVLVASNLKPAKIMGVTSQGMLLSIEDGKNLNVVTLSDELPIGKKLV